MDPDLLAAVDRASVRPARPLLPVVAWRWRYELLAVAAAVLVPAYLVWLLGPVWAAAAATLLASALTLRSVRALLISSGWCVITAHRIRVGLVEALVCSRTGKIPMVLATHAMPYGEEILLWCRAGTTAEDLERARPILRTACWAAEVWVAADPARTQLVRLAVVRRRPPPGLYPFADRFSPDTRS